ncbi:T9SS type A sorting domain-containing protein [candidate division KSB1 bacterium]|nr:T9SS type A sorting domain-containing protein [candidate division KSB1 bacterium]
MNPYLGQRFEVRVLDKATGGEVGRQGVQAINNADFDLELFTTIIGQSYQIDFYADQNNNGIYDSPPTDSAWRLELDQAQGNDTLTFTSNTNFTDTGFPTLVDFKQYSAIWSGKRQNLTFDFNGPIKVDLNLDVENGTVDGVVEAMDVFRTFAHLKLPFGGTFTVVGDSGEVTPVDSSNNGVAPLAKTYPNISVQLNLLQNSDWSGTLNFRNGRLFGDLTLDIMGTSVTVSINGTLGRTQAILEYSEDLFGAEGVILAREDTVLNITSVRNPDPVSIPAEFSLSQNFPNPFNPSTTITFEIPQLYANSNVNLSIYNLLGQKIRSLVTASMGAGIHAIQWDGKNDIGQNVASGLYLYRLTAGDFAETNKMLLLK